MADSPAPGEPWYCPVAKCDRRPYDSKQDLLVHLKKAEAAGDQNHIDIIQMEGWHEVPLVSD